MARRNSLSECRWKAHPFEDGIIVSTNGRILSYKSGEEYELTPSDNGRGYLTVSIGLRHPKYVHRLVAETYIPNPYNYPEVNHKDGNKRNNNVSNLEWCTRSDNKIHACVMGLNTSQKPVRIVETGEIFRSQNECARHIGGSASGIHDCKTGRHTTHRGYHFEFQDDNGEWYAIDRPLKDNRVRVKVIETGNVYDSISNCARAIGGSACGIQSCKDGRQKKHHNYHFEFLEDVEE